MLELLTPNDFDKLYALIKSAFPSDEYREYDEQRKLFDVSEYSVYALKDGEKIAAIIAFWSFNDFAYIEHFAVDEKHRNKGLGAKLLKEFADKIDKQIILEVELPNTETAKRRIGFYERNGFFLNNYPYVQPAFSKNKKPLPLLIMTSNSPVDNQKFNKIKAALYHKVYKII